METSFEVEVLKWPVKPQASDFIGGMIRLTVAYLNSTNGLSEEGKFVFFPKSSLQHLNFSGTTAQLLCAALRQLTILGDCNNIDLLASFVAAYLCSKYRFSPEILSGQSRFRPFIQIELLVVSQELGSADKFVGRGDLDELDNLIIHGGDFDVVRKVLNKCYSCGEEVAREMKEVKEAGLERKQYCVKKGDYGSDDSEEMRCPVCLERFGGYVVHSSCNHIFHQECISRWLVTNDSCPICRSACAVSV